MNSKYLGILACVVIAAIAWWLGEIWPLIGGPVFGILMGMILTLAVSYAQNWKEGAAFSGKKILQASVILLGFEMNIFHVFDVGTSSLIVMIFTLGTAFLSAWFLGKMLGINRIVGILIAVGTSICGGSAIAATAPVIQANEKEVAHSISTIFLFNIAAVFVFPALGHFFQMSDVGFGVWTGTAVNDTSSVLAAGYAFSNEAGNLATIVKLTRTLMIIPVTFVLSLYMMRQSAEKSKFSFSRAFPWFIIGFVIAAIIRTSEILPIFTTDFLATTGKFLIVVAMVGIGLNTHLGQLIRNGGKPILLGFLCWVSLAVVSLIIQTQVGLM